MVQECKEETLQDLAFAVFWMFVESVRCFALLLFTVHYFIGLKTVLVEGGCNGWAMRAQLNVIWGYTGKGEYSFHEVPSSDMCRSHHCTHGIDQHVYSLNEIRKEYGS